MNGCRECSGCLHFEPSGGSSRTGTCLDPSKVIVARGRPLTQAPMVLAFGTCSNWQSEQERQPLAA